MPTLTSSIIINASTQKVFDALTKPELVKLWQYGKILTTNWVTGSEINFKTEYEAKVNEQWGTVLEIQPPQLIKYNLFTPGPRHEDKIENYCITTYMLSEVKDRTKLELIHEDNRPGTFIASNLQPILITLKKIVESLP